MTKPVGKPDAGKLHVRFDERGEETERATSASPRLSSTLLKRNKTDVADAEAICEAVTRPTMRFVPVKTAEQQAASMILRTREMLMRQRSQTANALRAHMAELGIIAGTGMASIAKLLVLLRDEKDNRIPGAARFALILFAEQIELLTTRIEKLDREILVAVRKDPDARCLMSIPGVGPLIAATVRTCSSSVLISISGPVR
ncbi:transposase [Bradyrhizobium sp. RT9a]|uniref:IS110 family transposase n=1 Tax=Bradyrhizobium sp. RT9a TaxID=3156384 RepID=UPI0033985D56